MNIGFCYKSGDEYSVNIDRHGVKILMNSLLEKAKSMLDQHKYNTVIEALGQYLKLEKLLEEETK